MKPKINIRMTGLKNFQISFTYIKIQHEEKSKKLK